VLRVVFNPIHIDPETGDFKPSVIAEAMKWGCSVQRETHCDEQAAWALGERMADEKSQAAPDKPRAVHALAVLDVADLRRIADEKGTRAVAVYDTAKVDNLAHADVCVIHPNRSAQRAARADLFELARKGRKDRPTASAAHAPA